MKRFYFYISALLLTFLAVGCNEDFDTPPMVVPVAQHQPNMTIAEFKAAYWNDARNFGVTIEEDVIIHGWVSANDESGNIYKHMYIQDETGGIGISIDATSLYNTYRLGQELVLNLKGACIGKYNGEYLIGKLEWYAAQSVYEAGRMPKDDFTALVELNGLPNVDMVKPVPVKITDIAGKNDKDTQLKYQGQLVMFEDVQWDGADGEVTYAESGTTTTRQIKDDQGNMFDVTNSGYSNWYSAPMPLGKGNVVGIAYMTGQDGWKLYLRDTKDCIGFDEGTKGTLKDPYTVNEAIEIMNTDASGWVTGYIVGAVAPEVTEVKSANDVEWTAPTTLDNTLVIGESADTRDLAHCLVVALPQGTAFRTQASLKNFPELLGTQIWVKGKFATFMGTNGITENSGSKDEFKLSIVTGGVTELEEGFETGLPSDWTQVQVKGDKKWYQTTFDNNGYAAMTGYKGTAPFESWFITPALDIKNAATKNLKFRTQVNGYGSTTTKFRVFVMTSDDPTTATTYELNPVIATAPASGYSTWAESGDLDLSQWADGTYFIGFLYEATNDANYATWCIDDVVFGKGGPAPVSNTQDDFHTMNGGNTSSKATDFASHTSDKGWTAVYSSIIRGGDNEANPVYPFIGHRAGSDSEWAHAVYMNGNPATLGKLTSPVLEGGISNLTFNYGFPMTENDGVILKVEIVQNNQVVWSKELTLKKDDQKKLFTFSEDVNISGSYTIVFTPATPAGVTGNKNRVAVWNVVWTEKE
ncbi:MAG: hypothetical protein J6X70_02980 [Muribaculaceae bacterium]|nr:hypothetical protein [Muribaculaceae bacterium]